MKKSMKALLIAFVLAFTFTIPAASAGGLRDKLDGLVKKVEERFSRDEEEPVTEEGKKHALEKTVKGILNNLATQREETGISSDEALDNLMQMITDENGELDLSAVFGLLSMFGIGGDSETADTENNESGSYITALRNRDAVTEARLLEEYSDMIGEGDVPLITIFTITNDEENIDTLLGYFEVTAYTLDGANLKYKDSVSDIAYFVYNMDEDLNFEITEMVVARDDETINTLCGRHGIDRETFDRRTSKEKLDFFRTFDMVLFLENHPEYEQIEYNGEMYTKDELDALNTKLWDVMLSDAAAE